MFKTIGLFYVLLGESVTIKLLATADIHSPLYLQQYTISIRKLTREQVNPDLLILVGDSVEKNNIVAFKKVLDATREVLGDIPIVAIFGNEEYRGYEGEYIKRYREVHWVNDDLKILEVRSKRIGIIGSRGALDRLTKWQQRHMPELASYYKSLPGKLQLLLREARTKTDIVILATHYSPTYKTLIGEERRIWPELGSKNMEKVIEVEKPSLVLHGHAHNSKKTRVVISNVPVYNVSLPANNYNVVVLDVDGAKKTLDAWLGLG